MAEAVTVARPYAEAVFALADATSALGHWSQMLAAMATVAATPEMMDASGNPRLSPEQVYGIIAGASGNITTEAQNFLRVLIENRRLGLLRQIRAQFEALKNAREGVIQAEVYTAFELSDAQLAGLVAALEKRTGHKVRTQVRLDKTLIGGVRVVMGDKVIDGSARAQLGALESALKA